MSHLGHADVKIPLEALSYRFRKLQKHLSKEVEAEIGNITDIQDNYDEKKIQEIRSRLNKLRSMILSSDEMECKSLSKIETRASALLTPLSPEVG